MTGVVLLYVGVVLIVNGIWLIGQARAAAIARHVPARETAGVGATAGGRGFAADAAAGQELGGEAVVAPPPRTGEANPLFIQNREVAILNIFTGVIGFAIALTFIVVGNSFATSPRPAEAASSQLYILVGGTVLLFAFTYLWVAYNQYANAGGRALGWYSAFVAITAVYAGVWVVQNTPNNNTADLWLAADWFAWAVLWAMFFALLTLELPIARITGYVAIVVGVGTSWAFALALLWGKLAFAFPPPS